MNIMKIPDSPKELIKSLPKDLKDLLLKQWSAKQNPEWHPEGNTLKHIIVVLKRAYHHYPDDPNMIMAALFHDLGKVDTYQINPKTGQPTAYGHENKSTDYVEQHRSWIESFDGTDVDEIKYLVQNHMKVKPSTWNSMKDSKKEPIKTNKSFDKLMGFTDKLDGGGTEIEKKKLQETIRRILIEETNLISLRRNFHKIPNYIRATYKWLRANSFNNFDEFINRVIFNTTRDFASDYSENFDDYQDNIEKLKDPIKDIIMKEYYDEILEYYNKEMK